LPFVDWRRALDCLWLGILFKALLACIVPRRTLFKQFEEEVLTPVDLQGISNCCDTARLLFQMQRAFVEVEVVAAVEKRVFKKEFRNS
jgi:hypothetical protein